jgi:hypothetical protein
LHRRIGRDASTIERGVVLIPRAARVDRVVHELALRLRSASHPRSWRAGSARSCCLDDRESPRSCSGAPRTHFASSLSYPKVGADWRDDPIYEVHLFQAARRGDPVAASRPTARTGPRCAVTWNAARAGARWAGAPRLSGSCAATSSGVVCGRDGIGGCGPVSDPRGASALVSRPAPRPAGPRANHRLVARRRNGTRRRAPESALRVAICRARPAASVAATNRSRV